MLVKVLFTLVFLGIMVGVGVYSRKQSRSVDGFVLGGRSVGPWLTAFAYGTSYFSAVVFVGYAGQFGWKYGLSSTWIGVGNAVIGSMLAWLVLARRTRLMTQHIQSRTMPDFFGTRFDSEGLRVVASVIAFIFLIPYTAGVYMGISKLFETGFGVPYVYCAWTMAVLTAVYVILGGYKATAINDFIQGVIMLLGITTVIAVVLNHQGGLVAAVEKMAEVAPNADDLGQPGAALYANFRAGDFASLFGPNGWSLLGVVVLTSLGTWGLPQMVGKFYSITDESAIRRGTIISTLFAVVVAGGCYFLGGFGRLFVPTAFNAGTGRFAFDSIVPTMLGQNLPDVLMALVLLLVLSASMSTLASLVLTSSSTMTLDLIYRDRKSIEEEVSEGKIDDTITARIERRKVVVMRVLIVFFIVLSLMIALNPPHFIAQLMGISWGALAGAFLAPFMYGLYGRWVTRGAVWASFAWGVGLTVVNMILGNPMNPINCGAVAMLGGMVVVPLVSLFTPKLPSEHLDLVFRCYGERTRDPREEPFLEEKKTCGYCAEGEYLAAYGIKIGELPASKVYLFKEQSHKGRVIVAAKLHVSELTALTAAERNRFFADVDRVARAIHALYRPDKVNYGAYGDTGHHLHFHLVPKYANEAFEWGGTFAMNPKRTFLDDAAYDEMVKAYRRAIALG